MANAKSQESVEPTARIRYGDVGLRNVAGIDADIVRLKNAEEKLQFANTLLTTQMETSPDGILVVDADARIISFNRRFADMWDVSLDLLEAKDDAPVLAAVMSAMKDPQAFVARVKYLYQHPEESGRDELETRDGRFFDRHTGVLRTPAGDQLGRVWFFRDITERKLAEAEILRTARCDALTGLANRAVFLEAVQHAIATVKCGAKPFGVLYLDLDQFKDVNDTLGHPIGDELLKAVAGRLKSNTRNCDLVARFGGDEFAVLVCDVGEPANAAIVADTIIKAMAAPFMIVGNDIRCGVSIGISLFGPDEPDTETILSRADVALYRAKSERTGEYRFHTDAMDKEIRTRVTLGAELREGIALGQLFLEYQPQVDIATGRIKGVEALVRWRHPVTHGVLRPHLVHPGRGEERSDRGARPLGFARGLRSGQEMAGRRHCAGSDRGQSFRPPIQKGLRVGSGNRQYPGGDRPAALPAGIGTDRNRPDGGVARAQ